MRVHRGEDGAVEFRTHTLSEEIRQPQTLLESNPPRSQELLRACGWCKKVFVGEVWAEVEDALARLRLFERSLLPSLTHGICEQCYQKMVETLD
jgi:hypothetical protein